VVRGGGAYKGSDSGGEDFEPHASDSTELEGGEAEGSHVIDN
jgi:hypothetical protein